MGLYEGHEFSPFWGKDLTYTVRMEDGKELNGLLGDMDDPEITQIFEDFHPEKFLIPQIRLFSDDPIEQGFFYHQKNVTIIGHPTGEGDDITVTIPVSQTHYIGLGTEPYPEKYMFYVQNAGDIHRGDFYLQSDYRQVINFLIGKVLSPEDLAEFQSLFPEWDTTTSYYDNDIVSYDGNLYLKHPSAVAAIANVDGLEGATPDMDPNWRVLTNVES